MFNGKRAPWSKAKKIVVPSDAPCLPVPAKVRILDGIPRAHPRAFFTGERLDSAREFVGGGGRKHLETMQRAADRQLDQPLPAEPQKVDKGDWSPKNVSKYLSVHRVAARVCSRASRAAFVYLMTGRPEYGRDAKRCALAVSQWDPKGATNVYYSDYAAFYSLLALALPYDWAHDQFTEDERTRVREAIRVRGQLMYDCFHRSARIDVRPYHSHGWLNVRKLCIAAFAVAHEVRHAADWLHWAAQLHVGLFPAWGGNDGAWAQGVAYYDGSYTLEVNWFADLLRATGVDLYQKPWYRNTPSFLLYCCPPYGFACEFGDGAPGKRAGGHLRASMRNFAREYGSRYAAWYAGAGPALWGGWASFLNVLWHEGPAVEPKPPVDLPLSRWFRDVDWVVMHTDLTGADDVVFAMKSSSYASFNHSHCDQNSFTLSARGERLATDSGYYDYCGSAHHKGWTVQTAAHNAILVDGEGQPRGLGPGGFIVDHVGGYGLDYAAGDATPAYADRLTRWVRHALFVRPGCVVIADDVQSDRDRTYTWLLHALKRMDVNENRRVVTIRSGEAQLDARFLVPDALTFEQTDTFVPPPSKPLPNQWHLRATPLKPSEAQRFVVAFVPRKAGAEPVATSRLGGPGWMGCRLAQGAASTRCFFRTDPQRERIGPGQAHTDGLAGAVTVRNGRLRAVMMSQGTNLRVEDSEPIACPQPASVSLDVYERGAWITVRSPSPQVVRVWLPQEPVSLEAAEGTTRWEWQASGTVAVHCPEGLARFRCRFRVAELVGAPALVVLDGTGNQNTTTKLELAEAWPRGKTYAFGRLCELPAGRYRIEAERGRGRSPAVSIRVGRHDLGDLSEPAEVVLWRAMDVMVESEAIGVMPLRQLTVRPAGKPCAVRIDARHRGNTPGAIVVEAETFGADSSQELQKRREKYVSTSGEIVWGWCRTGRRVVWDIEAAQEGDYEIVVRGTSDHERTLGDLTIDGRFPSPALKQIVYPRTGGWGYAEGEWQSFLLCDESGAPLRVRLTAGTHRLVMTCLVGGMNLDYVMLVPAGPAIGE